MKKRFVFLYFMKREPEKIGEVVPAHVNYWKKANLDKYTGGPFADKSGGVITFEAENIEEATTIIQKDPFVSENLLEKKWIKEWILK